MVDEGIVRGSANGMPHGKIDLIVRREKSRSPYLHSTTVKSPVTFRCTKTHPLSPYLSILTGVVDAQRMTLDGQVLAVAKIKSSGKEFFQLLAALHRVEMAQQRDS